MSVYPESMIPAPVFANIEGSHGCGCAERPDGRWWLCFYHDGMCDGWWMRDAEADGRVRQGGEQ